MTKLLKYCLVIQAAISIAYTLSYAGITLDGFFGTSGPIAGPNYAITSGMGRQIGGNLFHSFGTFNLTNTEIATFTGPNTVENIISRVTGGSASNIDGLIRSGIQGANFYFINPSGIVFGPNARLDVGGSFHASTADYLKLGSDGRFDAKNPDNSALTSAPPSAFGFLGPNPAGITVQGSFLQVPEGKTLSIVGGDVNIENGYLYAPAGGINVVAAASAGEAVFSDSGLNVDGFDRLGDVNIVHNAADRIKIGDTEISNIDVSGEGGGSIFIRAGKFFADKGWIAADTYGAKDGAGIDINIKGEMSVSNNSLITSDTYGPGRGGDISVTAVSLSLTGGGQICANALEGSEGDAGNITIRASDSVTISGHSDVGDTVFPSGIFNRTYGKGKGGDTVIETGSLSVSDEGSISSETWAGSEGNGGSITITASDFVDIWSSGSILSETYGKGKAGDINIETGRLYLSGSGQISASAKQGSEGDGGNITIISDLVSISGAYLVTETDSKGKAGDITVYTGRLMLTDVGQINANAGEGSTGNGGNVIIYAYDSIDLSGYQGSGDDFLRSAIFSNTFGSGYGGYIYIKTPLLKMSDWGIIQAATEGPGDSGYILVEAEKVKITGGASIDTSSYGEGWGGYLMIKAKDSVTISGEGSGLYSNSTGTGVGGFIYVETPVLKMSDKGRVQAGTIDAGVSEDVSYILMDVGKLTLTKGAYIDTSSYGEGTGGYLLLKATDSVNISGKGSGLFSSSEGDGSGGLVYVKTPSLNMGDRGTIEARTSGQGPAGDIVVQVDNMSLKDNASISVESTGTGLAGNIVIEAANTLELSNSFLTAATQNADGGNIYINSKYMLDLKDSSITATVSGGTGNGGNITIDPVYVVLDNSRIIANAEGGDGGNISITAENFFRSPSSVVSASSRLGVDGTVVISSPAIDITGNLSVLPVSFLRADMFFPKPCAANEEEMSSFVLKGRECSVQQPDSVGKPADAYEAVMRKESPAETGDHLAASYSFGYAGQSYEKNGQFQEALYYTRRAVFEAQQVSAPESLYLWQWQSGRIFRALNRPEEALSAYRNAVYTLQSIRNELLADCGENNRLSFQDKVEPVYFELADMLLKSTDVIKDHGVAQAYLAEARRTIELLKTAELQNYFQDACVVAGKLKMKQLDVVSHGTAIIYIIPLNDRLELLLGLNTGIRRFTVNIGSKAFTEEVRQFRKRLEKRTTRQYLPHSQRLYDWLVRPLEQELVSSKIDTLVFVPHGALRTVPMSALHDGMDFLVQKFAIATTPGLSLTDPRPIRREGVKVLLNGLTESVQGFPALINVPTELKSIRELYPGRLLLNNDFRVPLIKAELEHTPYPIVHIASHGEFFENSGNTYILTWDGKLTMDQLEKLMMIGKFRKDPVELLTLSACVTAAGDDQAALGLAGVAVKAGARSALATLWYINDHTGYEISTEFYRQMQDTSFSKAKALQQAQIKLIEGQRFRHPGYWAPFLMIGNWL